LKVIKAIIIIWRLTQYIMSCKAFYEVWFFWYPGPSDSSMSLKFYPTYICSLKKYFFKLHILLNNMFFSGMCVGCRLVGVSVVCWSVGCMYVCRFCKSRGVARSSYSHYSCRQMCPQLLEDSRWGGFTNKNKSALWYYQLHVCCTCTFKGPELVYKSTSHVGLDVRTVQVRHPYPPLAMLCVCSLFIVIVSVVGLSCRSLSLLWAFLWSATKAVVESIYPKAHCQKDIPRRGGNQNKEYRILMSPLIALFLIAFSRWM